MDVNNRAVTASCNLQSEKEKDKSYGGDMGILVRTCTGTCSDHRASFKDFSPLFILSESQVQQDILCYMNCLIYPPLFLIKALYQKCQ